MLPFRYILIILNILIKLTLASDLSTNIVIILADDLGWNDINAHNKYVSTPNLDQLIADGVLLNQSYTLPMCTPSRHALLSGRYPFRDGIQHRIIRENTPTCSPLDVTFLPEVLKKYGYATHMVGKWHLGYCNVDCTPTRRGFDSFFGLYNGGADYYTREYMGYPDLQDGIGPAKNLYNGVHTTDLYVNKVNDILSNHNKSIPLFLYVALQAPHWPVMVASEYEDRYSFVTDPVRRKYLGLVSLMDNAVGRIITQLKASSIYDDTLILFMSDNGGAPEFGSSNYPLRGGKNTLWEGGTRVPTILGGGKAKRKQTVFNGLFHVVDWFPTFLQAAGVTDFENMDLDGISQLRSLQYGGDDARTSFVYNLDTKINSTVQPYNGYAAYRSGDYKLILGYPGVPVPYCPSQEMCERGEASRAEDLSHCGELEAVTGVDFNPRPIFLKWLEDYNNYTDYDANHTNIQLYNIRDDPSETHDLSRFLPEIRDQLYDELQSYIAREVTPQWPTPLKPGDPWQPIKDAHSYTSGWCSVDHLKVLRLQSIGYYDDVTDSGDHPYSFDHSLITVLSIFVLMIN